MINHYEILGICPTASLDEIKSAYRILARKTHPDRQGDLNHFHAVQQAYEVLGNAEKRDQYDQARSRWMHQIGALCCHRCGNANRVIRRPSQHERVCCQRCKTPLHLAWGDVVHAQRQSLAHEAARLVDEVGVDLADLASDAVRAGVDRLRIRFGLVPKARNKP